MPEPLYLGLDLGTSGARAVVIDAAGAQRGEIDNGLESASGLAARLRGAVEHRVLVGKPALHRQNAAVLHVHGHEGALHFRNLS